MGKPTIYIGENKAADQLRGNREAHQRLCFRYTKGTILISLLLKSEISSFWPASMTVSTSWFVLDLVGTQIVGFLTHRLNYPINTN